MEGFYGKAPRLVTFDVSGFLWNRVGYNTKSGCVPPFVLSSGKAAYHPRSSAGRDPENVPNSIRAKRSVTDIYPRVYMS